MSACANQSANASKCNCTYPCSKKGLCCECLHYHLSMNELPACCFPKDAEATYDRSFRKFVQVYQRLLK
ncbi:cytosolic protein [Candidatus Sumerlaeota bacterium]|nr:cytosolic protein [Candidatus Sumerlaeota bacterium]